MGADIPTEEKDHLSQAFGPTLKKLQKAVEANRLPKLPHGVLPRGWDAWGRPWALMDCPAEKVPQVVDTQGCERVTVAVLVKFHLLPECHTARPRPVIPDHGGRGEDCSHRIGVGGGGTAEGRPQHVQEVKADHLQ